METSRIHITDNNHSQCPTTTATQSERTDDVVVLFLSDSVCDFPKRRAIGDSDMRGHRETDQSTVYAHTADRQTDRQTAAAAAAAAARDDDAVKLGNSRDYKASALFHVTRRRANNLKLNRQSRAFSVKCTVMNPSMDFCLPSS